jgi:Fur family transcriptional regulator, zinc uptake regulator
MRACSKGGATPGPTRAQVEILDLIKLSAAPVKAYDLLRALSLRKGRVAPPTIYRALNALVEMGLIHRIESLNAFSACTHEAPGDHVFLLCETCGSAQEIALSAVCETLRGVSAEKGFRAGRLTLEVRGACQSCYAPTSEFEVPV